MLGATTLFVRFGECDLRCRWCDSTHTWRPAVACRIEVARGSGEFRSVPNPVTTEDAAAAATALEVGRHRCVSLTGGEPLLQPDAVAALAGALRGRGPEIWLETHGLAADALEPIVSLLDGVSMDWKLASDVRRASDPKRGPVADFHEQHERFLGIARRAGRVVVKIVVTPASRDDELEAAWAHIAAVDPKTPVVLQPVTPVGGVRERPSGARMLALVRRAALSLADVRVIPQTHPLLGVA